MENLIFVLWELLDNPSKESIAVGLTKAEKYYRNSLEYAYYIKTFSFTNTDELNRIKRDEIRSRGYIVDSLEEALWCVLTTDTYKECVLKTVNLGSDTDTIAALPAAWQVRYMVMTLFPKNGVMS